MNENEKDLRMTKTIAFSIAGTLSLIVATIGTCTIVDRLAAERPATPATVEPCHDSIEVAPWGASRKCEVGARLTVTNLANGQVVIGCACGAP